MAGNLVPRVNEAETFGTTAKRWLKGWFKDLFVSGDLTDGVNTVTVSNIATANLITSESKTDSYTLVLADAGKMISINKATATTLTVPKNSAVAFIIGTVVFIKQAGAGVVTVAPVDVDVTINSQDGLVLTGQYAGTALLKIDTNTWIAFGSLET